jgi:hypothetical protein
MFERKELVARYDRDVVAVATFKQANVKALTCRGHEPTSKNPAVSVSWLPIRASVVTFKSHACEVPMVGRGVNRRPPRAEVNCRLEDRDMGGNKVPQARVVIKPKANLTVRQVLKPIM